MPPFLGSKYRVFWSKMEAVDRIEDIQHPGVRGCLEYLGISEGVEINHAGDLPARSGLGSSSAFTVGMLHALQTLKGGRPGRATLANQAISVEQIVLKETVGIQDQIECTWGGLNLIEFMGDGRYRIQPLILSDHLRRSVEEHLVLVFTDLQRHASEIAKSQIESMNQHVDTLHRIVELVPLAADALSGGELETFGNLLHEAWMLKRGLSDKVSNTTIDNIYDVARREGAYGGKLLGAGGGGFLLLCVSPEKRTQVLEALGLLSVPVVFEDQGSQLVLAT